jgi:acetyl-CoA C-acetyltransferase
MARRQKRLARDVSVVGAGISHFGAFKEKDSRDLFVEAFQETLGTVQRGIDPGEIEAIYVGNLSGDCFEGQAHIAPLMAEWVGLNPKPATRIEDACASSGVALREGIIAVASGLYDIVLVSGVEVMNKLSTARATDTLAAAADAIYEVSVGATFPSLYAQIATAHMAQYGTTEEQLMKIGIKNHANGALNPKAHFNVSIRDIMKSRIAKAKDRGQPIPSWTDEMEFLKDPTANPVVAWPMKLFDCSPITDGAACAILVAEEIAKNFTDTPIHIIGTGQASDAQALHGRTDITSLRAAKLATEQAYDMAGVTPKDIQLAEVHDCFTIAEVLATEDLGFFKPGEGPRAAEEGRTARDGEMPINTSGGLKAKGHPVGATGVGQLAEVWEQMSGHAGPRQVPGVNLALTHNVGASGSTVTVHIFERR